MAIWEKMYALWWWGESCLTIKLIREKLATSLRDIVVDLKEGWVWLTLVVEV